MADVYLNDNGNGYTTCDALPPMVDGEPVTCIFNELMNFVLNLPLIQEALASIALS